MKLWDVIRAVGTGVIREVAFAVIVVVATWSYGVNMGTGRAGRILQRALNVLNVGGSLYPDLVVDGAIGPMTIQALRAHLAERNELVLCRALNCLQGAYYIELAERREKDEKFVYGWLKNRVVL